MVRQAATAARLPQLKEKHHERRHSPQLPRSPVRGPVQRFQVRHPFLREHQGNGQDDDGKEYPLYKLDTSSESHPFYTGTQKSVNDMGGRVDKFFKKFGKPAGAKAEVAAEAAK
jgi:ribosomal protein L31